MNLQERYKNYDLVDLMKIVENSKDYTLEAFETAKNEISSRVILPDTIKTIAKELMQEKIRAILNTFDVLNQNLTLPESYFLEHEETKILFAEVFEQWHSLQNDMTPDSMKYILGAFM